MDFQLSETQRGIQEMVRDFVRREVIPVAGERDRIPDPVEAYPWELVKKASKLGLRTLALPESLGGGGGDFLSLVIVCEELAYGDLGLAESFDTTLSWSQVMSKLMNEEQRSRFIPPFLKDDTFMLAQGLTEPDAGSDNLLPNEDPRAGVSTVARREGDEWVINGRKHFIANGNIAKLIFLTARTDPTKSVIEGCTLFAVPAGTPGFTTGRVDDKMGQRLANNAELIFQDCRVPDANRIGEENQGLRLLGGLSHGNVLKTAAAALGLARAAYDASLEFARQRVQGSRPIIEHQAVGMMLADMLMKTEAARSLTWRMGWAVDHQPDFDRNLCRLAKVFACEMAVEVTLGALEVFGGAGIMRDSPVEKLHRDAVTLLHSGGTHQILRIKVANALAGKEVRGW
ncbi:MAG: acyl-CoA dehydrogenase family protein [Candidatus Bipolaricaulia bacterium]